MVRRKSGRALDNAQAHFSAMKYKLLILIVSSCLTPWPVLAQTTPPSEPAPVSLRQVLQAARDNLDVTLARQLHAGIMADVRSADRAPFPVFSASVGQLDMQNGNGSGSFLTEQRVDKSVGLDWTWERGNKRDLRTRAAQNAAAAAQADLDETSVVQQIAALSSYYDTLAAQVRLDEVAQIERSAAELARIAGRRLQAGDVSAQDTARTEVEAHRVWAELRQAELERQRAALVLWQITGLPDTPETIRVRADWPETDEAPSTRSLDELVEARADVRAALARVGAAQSSLDNASAQKKSDITWGASYNHYPGTSSALLTLRMQMPLQWGYGFEGEIGRASAQLMLARDTLEKTRRQARFELQRLQREVQSAAARADAFHKEILPRARRVAEGAELAYRKGALSLTDLLEARRSLRITLLEAVAARSDHAKALGTWQLRSGLPVAASDAR